MFIKHICYLGLVFMNFGFPWFGRVGFNWESFILLTPLERFFNTLVFSAAVLGTRECRGAGGLAGTLPHALTH